jgi:hypothetical protein
VNQLDIPIFAAVLTGAITDPALQERSDLNGDFQHNGHDIAPFVTLLLAE